MSGSLDKNCLTFFGQLTEAQQLQAANELKQRLTPAIRNPSAFLTKIIADVLSGSITGRPTPPSPPQRSPPVPAISKDNLSMQGFTIEFLDYLSPECRRAYERLPPEAQYRMKQRCAGDKTVRTNSKAFLHAIYSTTGQGRPQPAYIAGMNGTGDDELIQAKWSDSSDGGQEYHDHPQTHSQAWPQDAPESRSWWLESETPSKVTDHNKDNPPHTEPQAWPQDAPESLARKSWSSDSQAPIKEAGQDTSMAAEIAHNKDDPRHTELQAWPQDAPEPKRSWSSESQAPSQGELQSTSVAADKGQYKPSASHNGLQALPPPNADPQPWEDPPPEGDHEDAASQQGGHETLAAVAPEATGVPATTEAIDTAARELMGLLTS
ncbi:g11283 [Coccomyxa viridis]|uniref:G11283 protein n=1 Tax=Coccomyxa viridis TaxID=1274662 RepID=A0ABP1GC01_9CHLO